MNAAFTLESVGVTYCTPTGVVEALQDVSLELPAASSTAVVGRSGSGKSTLVSVLALLRRPSAGRVIVNGDDVSSLGAGQLAELRSTRVGIVFQSFHLDATLRATENVMLPWFFGPRGESRATARRRAAEILDALGIGELADRRPNSMSGGQRQRVAIARALFTRPALFVADEPTGNLDEETANDVAATIMRLPAEFGATVVVVTHDSTVAAMAQRRVQLVRGNLQDLP